jgi:excisionase family DNA binding protein
MAGRPKNARPAYEFKATAAACRVLRPVAGEDIAGVQMVLADGRAVELPEQLAAVLITAVREAVHGRDLALLPRDEEISPAKAGELLGLSRQYVDRLIAEGVLPARRLPGSTHRKVRVADVMAFAGERARRQRIITDMVDTLTQHGATY